MTNPAPADDITLPAELAAALDRMDALLDPALDLLTAGPDSATAKGSRDDMRTIRNALADRASPSRAARDPRDAEAWEALGFLSGLHGFMTIDADQPMKMAQAIFDHVQAELKHWSDEAAKSHAMLVDLAQERGELARWRIAQSAAVDVGAAQAKGGQDDFDAWRQS